MENEKITIDTMRLIHPDALEKFIPKMGDRLAVLDFCSKTRDSRVNRRGGLLEKLRSKLTKHQDDHLEGKHSSNNKSAKPTRAIDIGWMHSEDGILVQVRSKQGGGTRKVSVNRYTKPEGILEIGKKIFFVDGMSKKGHISKFSFILCDFKCQEITEDITVEEMFQLTHMSTLRFYVTTFEKQKQKPCTKTTKKNTTMIDDLTSSDSDAIENVSYTAYPKQSTNSGFKTKQNIFSDQVKSLGNVESIELILDEDFDDTLSRETIETSPMPSVSFYSFNNNSDDNVGFPKQNKLNNSNDIVLESVGAQHNNENSNQYNFLMHDSEPLSFSDVRESIDATDDVFIIILHRGNVVEDLIRQFIPMPEHVRNAIKLEVYLPNGELEKAADIGGVFRDILSEFWQEFCNKYTLGTQARGPVLRHDFNDQKWTSVAKILAKGWIEENYFPCQISKCFMEGCMFDNIQSDLITDLFEFLSEMDSKILKTALQDFTNVDVDELLDCLDNLECKWKPNDHNIKKLLLDLAHKELIQKSTFVLNQWYPILKHLLNSETLDNIYEIQKNLNKSVIKALIFDDHLTEAQLKVANFLKKFIRESDHNILSALLRFVTGSNMLIPEKKILVKFIESTNDFCRTPTARHIHVQ